MENERPVPQPEEQREHSRKDGPPNLTAAEIWERYQRGQEQHQAVGLRRISEQCHRFFEGDQWHGIKSGGEQLPMLNIIAPICRYKIATVALNDTAIIYSAINGEPKTDAVCSRLTDYAKACWERLKLDQKKWDVVEDACITGDSYVYLFDERPAGGGLGREKLPRLQMRQIDRTNIYLADEQEPELDEQEYILLTERVNVKTLRRWAKQIGVAADEIEKIVSDEESEPESRGQEVKTDLGKCTSLLYMELRPEGIWFCRCCQNVIWQPFQLIREMKGYPLAGMRWRRKHRSARGIGTVEPLLANQIEINKTLARRALIVKTMAFPSWVVDSQRVMNPADLKKAGCTIRVQGGAGSLKDAVDVLRPPPMNGDAQNMQAELVSQTRELEGASDAATGQVDPTQASGEAIKAARDQSAMNLTRQAAGYRQFVEDLARAVYRLVIAYGDDGLDVSWTEEDPLAPGVTIERREMVSREELAEMEINVRIDVSPADPYSILSREMALENALAHNHISFEEYVEVLDDSGSVPKDKFMRILSRRALKGTGVDAAAQMVPSTAPRGTQDETQQEFDPAELKQLIQMGGVTGEMP